MEPTLLALLAGGSITIITQGIKKLFPEVTPLAVAAMLALLGGIGYAVLSHYSLWEAVKEITTVAFSASVAIYEVLKTLNVLKPNS